MTVTPRSAPPQTVREAVRPENAWYLRHAATLGRWPVLGEPWAQSVEARRLAATSGR